MHLINIRLHTRVWLYSQQHEWKKDSLQQTYKRERERCREMRKVSNQSKDTWLTIRNWQRQGSKNLQPAHSATTSSLIAFSMTVLKSVKLLKPCPGASQQSMANGILFCFRNPNFWSIRAINHKQHSVMLQKPRLLEHHQQAITIGILFCFRNPNLWSITAINGKWHSVMLQKPQLV